MKVVVSAGGTGGHIYPALAVLEKLKKEDKGQVEFYMNLVDNFVKEPSNNPTIGIIITKDQDKFVANFVRSEKVVPLTYEFV